MIYSNFSTLKALCLAAVNCTGIFNSNKSVKSLQEKKNLIRRLRLLNMGSGTASLAAAPLLHLLPLLHPLPLLVADLDTLQSIFPIARMLRTHFEASHWNFDQGQMPPKDPNLIVEKYWNSYLFNKWYKRLRKRGMSALYNKKSEVDESIVKKHIPNIRPKFE